MWQVCQSDPWKKYLCFLIYLNASLCVCVCSWEKAVNAGVWLDQRRKDTFIYAYWHTYESPYVILCAPVPVIVFEVRQKIKAGVVFPYLCFIQQDARTHRLSHLKPRALEFDFFIYHWKSTRAPWSNNVTLAAVAHVNSGLDLFTHQLWHTSPQIIPVTWPERLWPVLTLLLKRTQLCSWGQAEPRLITLYTPLGFEGARWRKSCSITPD